MSKEIVLETGRESIQVNRGGQIEAWEYDVVEMKLLCESIQDSHGLKKDGKYLPPTAPMLQDLASRLFEGCTIDAAYRFLHLVNTQFQKLHANLAEQLKAS